ncbi:LuxR C-terminal-related transcriptional regulator [Actinoplanes sp. NPDC051411]|uniref:LuxR C-terminal-related transcriptional regulator n=1 Tax=Actinoplanes sp. NPDC051411 TaxID=3155522 RepID=UPI0034364F66
MPNELTLTPVERRIAELAATGLTNNEIGRRLFLSGRTIGTYLGDLYPKLGVSSRAGLADALSRPGKPPGRPVVAMRPGELDDPAAFRRACGELAYGRWLRRHRRPKDARRVLTSAVETFERLGAGPWAERARSERDATAATRAGDPERLTPQESMVAELAAEGLTNRQIGERLLVSPRTVGSHLGRVFPKLGVGSRAALRGALNRRSPLGLTVD